MKKLIIITSLFCVLISCQSEEKRPNEIIYDTKPNKKIKKTDPVDIDMTSDNENALILEMINAEKVQEKREWDSIYLLLTDIAQKDWPDDYSTQDFWLNLQKEDYQYMKWVPDEKLKKKAQRDWPLDFSTQKFWYDKQIEAKERLNNQ